MTGLEMIVGVFGPVITALLIALLKILGNWAGVDKDSKLYDLISQYIDKALDNYEDDVADLAKKGITDITKDYEIVQNILVYLNNNAPKLLKKYFGTNQEQLEEFVVSYVKKLIK